MKAGIITFASAHNYGALLQVYALSKYLESIGLDVEVINYRPKSIDNVYKLYRIKKSRSLVIKAIRKIKVIFITNLKYRWKLEKHSNFESFISNKLNTTKEYKTFKELKNTVNNYDILIAGSDQIWNTDLTKGFDYSYFLEFGKKDAIRIAYAPSLGRNNIDEKYRELYRRYLKNFDFISVREKYMIDVLKPLTDKKITQVVDPTLLIDKKYYDELKEKSKYHNEEYIYVHFISKDERLIEIASKISSDLNIKILHNFSKSLFKNELSYHYCEGVEKLIDVVENAKMVITNSFHLTILSIIYKKQFITVPHQKRPERMVDLLKMLDLDGHLVEDVRSMKDLKELKIDYKRVQEKIEKNRNSSIDFLKNALSMKEKSVSNYFETKDKFDCYGCTLCRDICPVHAITMVEDKEGFIYPHVNEKKCIHCNLCKKRCIANKKIETNHIENFPKVYALTNNNKEITMKSSSGGVFTELYKYILKKGGYVVGVRYDENMVPIYDITNEEKVCESFRGSKYVAANVGNIKSRVKEKLEDNKIVLFCGNPCQVYALKQFLNKDYDNLYLVEIICHSTPSPKIFRGYIQYLQNKYNSKVTNFEFRNKRDDWKQAMIKVTFENGLEKYESSTYNNFSRAFHNSQICRPSCYNCKFSFEKTNSDIVIGDYWGIEKIMPEFYSNYKNIGISLMRINTPKGETIFNDIKDKFEYYESNIKDAYNANHNSPILYTAKRQSLMENIDETNINEILIKYNQFKNKDDKESKERINDEL